MNEYLSIDGVVAMTTFSVATIYRLISKSGFPPAREIAGVARSLWIRSEIIEWMESNLKRKSA